MASPLKVEKGIYRFYNAATGGHFYTADYEEALSIYNNLPEYRYEEVAYGGEGSANFYRFYNKVTRTHFFTADPDESASVKAKLSNIYTYEGVAFQIAPAGEGKTAPQGKVALHRFYNQKQGVHFFTADEKEFASVLKNLSDTYTYEGIAAYVTSKADVLGNEKLESFKNETYNGPLPAKYGEDGKGARFEGKNATVTVLENHKIFNPEGGKPQAFVSKHSQELTFDASQSKDEAQLKVDLSGESAGSVSRVKLGKGAAMTAVLGAGNDDVTFGGATRQTLEITDQIKGKDQVKGLKAGDVIDFGKLDLDKITVETDVGQGTILLSEDGNSSITLEEVAGLTRKTGSKYKVSGPSGETPEKFSGGFTNLTKTKYKGDLPTKDKEFTGQDATIVVPKNHEILTLLGGETQVFTSKHSGELNFSTESFASGDKLKVDLSGEAAESKSMLTFGQGGAAVTVVLGDGSDTVTFGGATRQTLEFKGKYAGTDTVKGLKAGDTINFGTTPRDLTVKEAMKALQVTFKEEETEKKGALTLQYNPEQKLAGVTKKGADPYKLADSLWEGNPGPASTQNEVTYIGMLPENENAFYGKDATIAVSANHDIFNPGGKGPDPESGFKTFTAQHAGKLVFDASASKETTRLKVDLSGEKAGSTSKVTLGKGEGIVSLGAGNDDVTFRKEAQKNTLQITLQNQGNDRVEGLKKNDVIKLVGLTGIDSPLKGKELFISITKEPIHIKYSAPPRGEGVPPPPPMDVTLVGLTNMSELTGFTLDVDGNWTCTVS